MIPWSSANEAFPLTARNQSLLGDEVLWLVSSSATDFLVAVIGHVPPKSKHTSRIRRPRISKRQ